MVDASKEIRVKHLGNDPADNIVNIDISTDGAWQRRGYASLNGLVTVIAMETNQCVDFEVLSKVCKTCQVLEKKKGDDENKEEQHDCQINHQGSAGSMESAGVISCFKRSIEKNLLRYTTYIGMVTPVRIIPL